MQRITFLRSTILNLSILALILLGYSSVYAQTKDAQDTRRTSFGVETGGGLVFSSGSSGSAWGRTWLVDLEANVRFPISTDNTSLYIGIHRTSFGKDLSKELRGVVVGLPSGDIGRHRKRIEYDWVEHDTQWRYRNEYWMVDKSLDNWLWCAVR
jgi:hypothetical protein